MCYQQEGWVWKLPSQGRDGHRWISSVTWDRKFPFHSYLPDQAAHWTLHSIHQHEITFLRSKAGQNTTLTIGRQSIAHHQNDKGIFSVYWLGRTSRLNTYYLMNYNVFCSPWCCPCLLNTCTTLQYVVMIVNAVQSLSYNTFPHVFTAPCSKSCLLLTLPRLQNTFQRAWQFLETALHWIKLHSNKNCTHCTQQIIES